MRKLNISKHQNFLATILVIHFGFFGYICYFYPDKVGIRLLFFNLLLFKINPIPPFLSFDLTALIPFFYSLIILIVAVFLYGISERFFEYGIRNSIWLVPIIVIESWIWYFIIGIYHSKVYVDLGDYFFNTLIFPWSFILYFFMIFILFIIIFIVAFIAAFIRQLYEARISINKKMKE